MDLSKLSIKPTKHSVATSPKEIFRSLTLRGSIQNIWEPQAEALAEWDKNRTASDTVIQMNTGGGKTLAGLLIAQSLVNETKGKVLYVCPTKQLVEQVESKADECGIAVATYLAGTWKNDQTYDQALGPCITTYAAVFNGRSIFRDHEIRGIVFDDAHVAGNFVRGQFTLKIPKGHSAFEEVAELFRSHFVRNGQVHQFAEALAGDWFALLFVPAFEVQANAVRLGKILLEHGVDKDAPTMFPWAYLKDRLARCAVFISGSGIEITPVLLPVSDLPFFGRNVRRVYLTATMPSEVEFIRTFGVGKVVPIAPSGKSGEAQRQFLFVRGEDDEERRQKALKLVEKQKACIIAPSDRVAEEWCPPAIKFDRAQGHAAIEAFAKSKNPDKLALAARYDGIDLPGDACRVLILAGLPQGETLIDRFIDQTLRIERLRTAHVATRVVQAIGRIFRSNTDHGAVLVTNHDLERWLVDPQNLRYMPGLLQRQIKLGIELRRNVEEGQATPEDLLNAVLTGRKDWDTLYAGHVGAFETHDQRPEPTWFVEAVARERLAFDKLWKGNYAAAANEYAAIAKDNEERDPRLSAWYRHWEGLAYSLAGDAAAATRAYLQAANERSELGRPYTKQGLIVAGGDLKPSPQAERIANIWTQRGVKVFQEITQTKKDLAYGPGTNSVEQALRDMGELLGLQASRPEKEHGTGPDVLWQSLEHKAGAAIEAKTNKKDGSQYRKKDDIGQFHDHVQWLEKKFAKQMFHRVIVGKKHPVAEDANPPENLRIIALEQFQILADRLKELYEYLGSTAKSGDVAICAERGLESLGLNWPKCLDSLESWLALDLKSTEPPQADGGD